MTTGDAAALAEGDLRTMPLFFDPQGERRQTMADVAALSSERSLPGGFKVTGPGTLMWTLKYVRNKDGPFLAAYEIWTRMSKVAAGDSSVYEPQVISRVLDAAASQDQHNLPFLEPLEL
eukprot:790453-Pyramimonas_sp.AAC.1